MGARPARLAICLRSREPISWALDQDRGGCRLTDAGDRTQDVMGQSTLIGGAQPGLDFGLNLFEGRFDLTQQGL